MSVTQSNHNATTGPAGGAALAALSGLAAGLYEITVYAYLSGTVTAGDADNVELLVDGSVTDVLAVEPVADGSVPAQVFEHDTTTGAIKLQAVGAGGGSAVYHTLLVVAPLPPASGLG